VTIADTFRPALGSMIGGAGLSMDKEGLPIVAPGRIKSALGGELALSEQLPIRLSSTLCVVDG
jgi:hypothetical protein